MLRKEEWGVSVVPSARFKEAPGPCWRVDSASRAYRAADNGAREKGRNEGERQFAAVVQGSCNLTRYGLDRRGTSLPGMCFLRALHLPAPFRPSSLGFLLGYIRSSRFSPRRHRFSLSSFLLDTHMYITQAEQTSRSQPFLVRGGSGRDICRGYRRKEDSGWSHSTCRFRECSDSRSVGVQLCRCK